MQHELNDLQRRRREELQHLLDKNVNPYPSSFPKTDSADFILRCFTGENAEEMQDVAVAGRIMAIRRMGKAAFFHIQDETGRIQCYIRKDDIENFDDFKLYDIGDIVGVQGYVFTTKMGETTVHARSLTLLCKSLSPIPIAKEAQDEEGNTVVYDAFADKELRYRQRYTDLIVNPHIKQVFKKRAQIIQSIRQFFDGYGWLEVDTPILQPLYGGAYARPFVTHHNALDMPLYLRIATELYLKRLIVGGFEGVYEIGKNFRNEGMDKTHNPEFSALEVYVAYKDYVWMMSMVEELLNEVVRNVNGSETVVFNGQEISFAAPFARIPMVEAIEQELNVNIHGLDETALRAIAKERGVGLEASAGVGKIIDELFSAFVQPKLIQPTFITDYPIELSPLAKSHRSKPGLTERFELFIAGKEVANAFSELNDPLDQRQRLEDQAALRARGDDEAMTVDEDFLHALEIGMPPTAGLGIGVDRLIMLLTDNESIRDVLLFPTMKPEKTRD